MAVLTFSKKVKNFLRLSNKQAVLLSKLTCPPKETVVSRIKRMMKSIRNRFVLTHSSLIISQEGIV